MSFHKSAAARLASGLAVLKGLGVTDRDTHLRVLRETLDNHPHCFGVWAVWEPDALDGNDAACANRPGHDASGRFNPVWHRRLSEPRLEFDTHCEDPHGCYRQAVLRRRPVLVLPSEHLLGRGIAPLATIAAPIMLEQQSLGAAGVDFSLGMLATRLTTGNSQDALEQVYRIAEELEVGLVFLDRGERVIACSAEVHSIVDGFTSSSVKAGQSWPDDLTFVGDTDCVIQRHGTTLKAVRFRQRRDVSTIIVLTRSVAGLDVPSLSSREDEVMQWLSEGKSNEEIGIILSISPHTVKNHLDRIYRKIGVANRHAATLAWSRSKTLPGMVPLP